jgi:hypothetical protein
MVVLLGLLALSACRDALSADHAITLNETCAVTVPTEGSLSGGSITDGGAILLWTRESNVIWSAARSDEQARAIVLPFGTDVVAAAWVGRYVEVVDGGRRQIIQLDAQGVTRRTTNVSVPIRLHAAARLPSGWVVGGAGIDGNEAIAAQRGDTFAPIVVRGPVDGGVTAGSASSRSRRSAENGDGFFLAPHGDEEVLISWVVRPHRTAVVSLRGEVTWYPSLPHTMLREMSANKNGWYLWNALPALSAANGVIVQTVADLGSVQRKVLLRNAHGTAVRMTPVDAPIGVVGASPSGRLLLAVSRVPQPHAICYEVVQ